MYRWLELIFFSLPPYWFTAKTQQGSFVVDGESWVMRAFDVCTDICTYVFSCDDDPSITRLKVILFASNFCVLQSRAAKNRQVRPVASTSGDTQNWIYIWFGKAGVLVFHQTSRRCQSQICIQTRTFALHAAGGGGPSPGFRPQMLSAVVFFFKKVIA